MSEMIKTRRGLVAIAAAAALACAFVLAAASFEAHDPAPSPPHEGIAVEAGAVRLAEGAPQWRSIEVQRVLRPERIFGEPAPARVRIDESRASRPGSPLNGRITAIHVDLGERVKEGQPLFSVASATIAELRAERERARVDLAVAKSTHERVQALVEAKALPAKEELAARQQLESASLAVRQAQEKLRALGVASRDGSTFDVLSPRDGVVVERSLSPGQEVSPDSASLLVIAATDPVWVMADLLPAEAHAIREGAAAKVTLPTLPGRELEGVVERVSAVVDPRSNTVPVRIRVRNDEGLLRPNLFVQARIEQQAEEALVEVPSTAVVSDGARRFVFVEEEPGRFAMREVHTRSSRRGRVPVVAGLRPDEAVVSRGAVLLQNHLALYN